MTQYENFANVFREHLLSRGYGPRPGASEMEIAAFESRHSVRLPDDLREYFLEVNGTADYPDDLLTIFRPLEDVSPISESLVEGQTVRYFVIADQMISAPDFAIALGSSPAPYVVRCWSACRKLEPVSDSFSTFVRLFMEDPWTVHVHNHAPPA